MLPLILVEITRAFQSKQQVNGFHVFFGRFVRLSQSGFPAAFV